MTKNLGDAQFLAPETKIWRRWKWIGLAVFAAILIFGRWLPGVVVFLGYFYGIIVIANLLFLFFRRLKNRMFCARPQPADRGFLFRGGHPTVVLLAGILGLSGYVLFGQLASRYLENSLEDLQHQLAATRGTGRPVCLLRLRLRFSGT